MAQQINVPGVGLLSFPDGMADADIQAAIHKNFPQLGAPPAAPSALEQAGGFIKDMAQSGGRQLMGAATAIPGIFADGAASAVNLVHGRDAPTLQQVAAGQPGDYPFPTLPSDDFKQRLAPVLGTRPSGASGIAEDVGSAVIGGKLPMPGQAAATATQAAAPLATRAAQLKTLADEGVQLDSHQALGGKLALDLKNAANDGAYGSADAFRTQQNSQFTTAALRQMGVNAQEATPKIMSAGKQALKQTYNAIAARTSVQVDSDLNNTIGAIRYAVGRSLTTENAHVIENQLQDIEAMAQANGGKISGDGYQRLQESLGDVAKDGGKAPFITKIRQGLTDALGRQASPEDAKLLATTNQRYGAMKAIEKAVDANNQVSPSALYNAMDTVKGSNLAVYGQGSNSRLMDLAQAGKSILGTNTANSGTPQRLAGMLAVGQAGAAATALATGHHDVAAGLLGTALAAGFSQKAAKALVYSEQGRAYLQGLARTRQATSGLTSAVLPASAGGAVQAAAAGSQSYQPDPTAASTAQ